MNKRVNHIFSVSQCPSEDILLDYVKGRLDPAQKHNIEKHLADCDICSDYSEGISFLKDPEHILIIVSDLNKKIDKKTNFRGFNYRTIVTIAAACIVLFGITFILQTQFGKEKDNVQLAQEMNTTDSEQQHQPIEENENSDAEKYNISTGKKAPPLAPISIEEDISDSFITTTNQQSPTTSGKATNQNTRSVVAFSDIEFEQAFDEEQVDNDDFTALEEASETQKKDSEVTIVSAETITETSEKAVFDRNKVEASTVSKTIVVSATTGSSSDKGIGLYEKKEYKLSAGYFESILRTNPTDQTAQWYYALNLIKLKRNEEAKILLKAIIQSNSKYKKQAEKELKKL